MQAFTENYQELAEVNSKMQAFTRNYQELAEVNSKMQAFTKTTKNLQKLIPRCKHLQKLPKTYSVYKSISQYIKQISHHIWHYVMY